MALTELQLPSKETFYRAVRGAATEMDNLMNKWRNLSEYIGFVGTVDLDAMGVAPGQVRTDLTNFRTAINELLDAWDGNAVTPTNVPADVVDKIRNI